MDLEKLSDKFPASDVKWRQQGTARGDGGFRIVPYIDNRAVMDRLDEVCGVTGWKSEFREMRGGALCGISIQVEGAFWVTKWDGAPETKIEAYKGMLSDSMRRAAVHWGIGRYLYKSNDCFSSKVGFADKSLLEDAGFKVWSSNIDGKWVNWIPPNLPMEMSITEEQGYDHYGHDVLEDSVYRKASGAIATCDDAVKVERMVERANQRSLSGDLSQHGFIKIRKQADLRLIVLNAKLGTSGKDAYLALQKTVEAPTSTDGDWRADMGKKIELLRKDKLIDSDQELALKEAIAEMIDVRQDK